MLFVLLMFMYIFSFSFANNNYLNSTYIVGLILSVFFLVNFKYRSVVIDILRSKKTISILLFLVLIITYCLVNSSIQMTYDFSIIQTFLNQFFHLLIGLLFFGLYQYRGKQQFLLKHIVYAFILQSLIQFVSFINPQINELLNVFRNENAIIKGQNYGNIRGLSISGSAFYGLGVGYGLILIYYCANWKAIFYRYKVLRFIFLILLLFGALSAARSSVVGLLLGLIYLIFKKAVALRYKVAFRFNPFLVLLTIFIIVSCIFSLNLMKSDQSIQIQFDKLNRFVFQPIYNHQQTGNFSTSSTDLLFSEMYFPVDQKTFIIGDAHYTNKDGSYYRHTDAGYMRNVLYFGVLGLLVLLLFQFCFFFWSEKKQNVINLTILCYILIMHVKGEILGFSVMLQSILFLNYLRNAFWLITEQEKK